MPGIILCRLPDGTVQTIDVYPNTRVYDLQRRFGGATPMYQDRHLDRQSTLADEGIAMETIVDVRPRISRVEVTGPGHRGFPVLGYVSIDQGMRPSEYLTLLAEMFEKYGNVVINTQIEELYWTLIRTDWSEVEIPPTIIVQFINYGTLNPFPSITAHVGPFWSHWCPCVST